MSTCRLYMYMYISPQGEPYLVTVLYCTAQGSRTWSPGTRAGSCGATTTCAGTTPPPWCGRSRAGQRLLGKAGVCNLHHDRVATNCFKCPYHGWTYGLDGRLTQARRLRGIQQFRCQR